MSTRQAYRAMTKAIKRLEEVLPTAKNPQAIAVSAGILHDKSVQMAALVQSLEEADVRIGEDQAKIIVTVLGAFLEACGIPMSEPARTAMRELLHGAAERAGVIAVGPSVAEELRAGVSGHFERLLGRKRAEDGSETPLLPSAKLSTVRLRLRHRPITRLP